MLEFNYVKIMGLSGIVMIVVLIQLISQLALADEINPGLYSPNSSPYGTSFSNWTTKW